MARIFVTVNTISHLEHVNLNDCVSSHIPWVQKYSVCAGKNAEELKCKFVLFWLHPTEEEYTRIKILYADGMHFFLVYHKIWS